VLLPSVLPHLLSPSYSRGELCHTLSSFPPSTGPQSWLNLDLARIRKVLLFDQHFLIYRARRPRGTCLPLLTPFIISKPFQRHSPPILFSPPLSFPLLSCCVGPYRLGIVCDLIIGFPGFRMIDFPTFNFPLSPPPVLLWLPNSKPADFPQTPRSIFANSVSRF